MFNKLTGEEREKSDKLFTTLSTTVRRLTIGQKTLLISDTVGFISKLPAYMIEAFKSTLEELLFSDLVLVVIDVSDLFYDLKKKFKSCKKTLNEIGVEQDRIVYALNKADMIDKNEILQKVERLGLTENKKWIPVSAKTEQNLKGLKELMRNVIDSQIKPITKKKSLKEELEKIYGN